MCVACQFNASLTHRACMYKPPFLTPTHFLSHPRFAVPFWLLQYRIGDDHETSAFPPCRNELGRNSSPNSSRGGSLRRLPSAPYSRILPRGEKPGYMPD